MVGTGAELLGASGKCQHKPPLPCLHKTWALPMLWMRGGHETVEIIKDFQFWVLFSSLGFGLDLSFQTGRKFCIAWCCFQPSSSPSECRISPGSWVCTNLECAPKPWLSLHISCSLAQQSNGRAVLSWMNGSSSHYQNDYMPWMAIRWWHEK